MTSQYATRAEFVYAAMVHELHAGQFCAGQRIVETELARRLEVSVTPVREALRRLEADGILVRAPHSGARIRRWTATEAAAVYEARMALEGDVARLAALRAQSADIEKFRHLLDEQILAMARDERPIAQQYDTAIHLHLGTIARSEVMAMLLAKIWLIVPVLRTAVWIGNLDVSLDHMIPDHELLYHCIERRNPEAAQAVARQHVQEAWYRLARLYELHVESSKRSFSGGHGNVTD